MVVAIQQMVEVHTEIMQVMTQYMVNGDSKELPPGMEQVLDNHSQMVQMIPHMLAVADNNPPQNNLGSKEPRGEAEITLLACKICGEIGHTSNGCCEQCPYCNMSHPVGECSMAHVTCFLCDGINHVPNECKFYSTVQRMNQRAKDGLYQQQERTPVDGRSKVKLGIKVMEKTLDTTTKCCHSCGEDGHLSRNCSKKRERFPTVVVEYQENEIRDLLALELPTKKKKKHVYSKVLCSKCKELGHYASRCPKRYNKANTQGSVKKELNHVTCFKCK
jgi:hypothetical protein